MFLSLVDSTAVTYPGRWSGLPRLSTNRSTPATPLALSFNAVFSSRDSYGDEVIADADGPSRQAGLAEPHITGSNAY